MFEVMLVERKTNGETATYTTTCENSAIDELIESWITQETKAVNGGLLSTYTIIPNRMKGFDK